MKLLDATFNEYKKEKEAEIKRYQVHIEHLKSQVKGKREALKHFKEDAALQAKCRKLAFDSIELENRNTIFDYQKEEIQEQRNAIIKDGFPVEWIHSVIEDERANIEQLEEYKIIQEKAMQEEIYGDVDWYHNWQRKYYKGKERDEAKEKAMWEEYLEKILHPAHERIEKIYLENGIEACDLFHLDDLEKVFSKKVYDAVEGKAYQKTIFENKYGNFVRHQGFWKKVHIIENDKLKYYNEWVFEKRYTQWFKDNYDEIMEEIKQRKYANGAGVGQGN